MSSSLDSGSKLLGLRLDRINVMCSLAKFFTFTLPLSTQGYKWVLGNCQGSLINAGGGGGWRGHCDGPTSHPGGKSDTPSRFMVKKPA